MKMPSLEIVATWANIITACSFVLTILEYLRTKKLNKTAAVADQISFFNEKVLKNYENFLKTARELKGSQYNFKRVQLDDPNFKSVRSKYFHESKEQFELVSQPKLFSLQTEVLNYLEEISIRIIHYDTINHKAIDSIKYAFIEIIEVSGTLLLFQKELVSSGTVYSYTIKLYSLWKDQVDRTSIEIKLKKFISGING